jgi:alpha-L-rhamnosidase
VPVCVPNYPKHKAYDVAWSGNYPTAVWYFYQYYDDRRALEDHYESMKRWVDYVATTAENDHTINKGRWGDHMMPGVHPGEDQYLSKETPPALCWTGYYSIVTPRSLHRQWRSWERKTMRSVIAGWRKRSSQRSTRSGFIPIRISMRWTRRRAISLPWPWASCRKVIARVLRTNVARDITEKYTGHIHTGIIGTTAMVETLVDNGYVDVMYRLVNRPDYPG